MMGTVATFLYKDVFKMQIHVTASFVLADLHLPHNATPLTMLWVAPGTFRMGDPGMYLDGGQPFDVVLTRGFWLGQYLVTQAQWEAIMGDNPSRFQVEGINRPVENITWNEAMVFCDRLNAQWERYLPTGYTFSLPTEVQWEYACRAGTQSRYYNGDDEAALDAIAGIKRIAVTRPIPLAQKPPIHGGSTI
ncbi:formylglycine-generating enzyme family protein [bacterium]|nr:formylglycine-generating enzyme family protein [bacterium]